MWLPFEMLTPERAQGAAERAVAWGGKATWGRSSGSVSHVDGFSRTI